MEINFNYKIGKKSLRIKNLNLIGQVNQISQSHCLKATKPKL